MWKWKQGHRNQDPQPEPHMVIDHRVATMHKENKARCAAAQCDLETDNRCRLPTLYCLVAECKKMDVVHPQQISHIFLYITHVCFKHPAMR